MVILDSSGFNQIAKSKAVEIVSQGWGAWQLRLGAKQQSPAGITSVFYVLITPKPYSVLSLNAFVYAVSGCLVLFFGVVFSQFQILKHLQADYGGASNYENLVQPFRYTKSVEKTNQPPQAASSVWDSWSVTDGLPPWIDHKLFTMHQRRVGAINAGGNTLIDRDILLLASEFLWYFPRALQVGLFSPFPEFWSGNGITPAMTIARKLMGGG